MQYPPVAPNGAVDFTKTTHHDTYPEIDSATKSDCSGKYVFITGSSKGVGRATAISYAKAGAEGIALGARSDQSSLITEIMEAAKAAGKKAPKLLPVTLDLLDETSVKEAARKTEEAFGKLDILINNAAHLSPFVPLLETDSVDYWMDWETNIRGVYLMTKAFLPLLLKRGDKTIVNVASIGSLILFPGASGYQTSKFALLRLTEFINVDYAEQGILAYAVHPGSIMTKLSSKLPSQVHHLLGDRPELSADTMVLLTSKKREWLAGRYIACPWDMPEFLSKEDEIVKRDLLKMRLVL